MGKTKVGEVGYNTSGSISWHHRGVYTEEGSIAITLAVYYWATFTEAKIDARHKKFGRLKKYFSLVLSLIDLSLLSHQLMAA